MQFTKSRAAAAAAVSHLQWIHSPAQRASVSLAHSSNTKAVEQMEWRAVNVTVSASIRRLAYVCVRATYAIVAREQSKPRLEPFVCAEESVVDET